MIKITKTGWIYIVLTILIGFSAVNTANNLVYIVAAAFLSYMLISGIFGRRNLQELAVELEMPDEVYARTSVPVKVRLVNGRGLLPAFLIKVLAGERELLFPFVEAGSRDEGTLELSFDRRGLHKVQRFYLSSVFPFNFFIRYKKLTQPVDFVVFPRPLPCDWKRTAGVRRPKRGDELSRRTGYDADIVSIRDYATGDPLKYISWKSTAKTGKLKTKEMSALEDQPVLIDFDNFPGADLEMKLSCVTYLVLKLFRSRVPFGLVMHGETIHWDSSRPGKLRILKRLALYGQD